jgi:DNA polymerase III subunit delta
MRISSEQLAQHLARDLKPLYIVFGSEPLLALEAADRIRAKAHVEGYIEREILTVDSGFSWSELAMAANAQSLFASRKLLDLRIPGGKPGVEGAQSLQSFCATPPVDTITLISLPGIDWRAQKAGWFTTLERVGLAVEAKEVARKSLPLWLASRLKAQDQEADTETLSFIADKVEGNLLAAYQEVQKLALLCPAGKITFEQAREAVLDVARYDVFNLAAAMAEGDPVRLVRMLDGLKGEGTAAPLVLWAMTEEIRAIGKLVASAATGKPLSALWRELRIWDASHQKALQQNLRGYTAAQVRAGLGHAAVIDRMIKGLAKGDVWNELLRLALRFARIGNAPQMRPKGATVRETTASRAASF